jgi:hypothetical protein
MHSLREEAIKQGYTMFYLHKLVSILLLLSSFTLNKDVEIDKRKKNDDISKFKKKYNYFFGIGQLN